MQWILLLLLNVLKSSYMLFALFFVAFPFDSGVFPFLFVRGNVAASMLEASDDTGLKTWWFLSPSDRFR